MPVRINIDGVAGKAAIYTGSDDLPMDNPLGHVARLKFHSGLHNIAVTSVHTGTLNLSSVAANSYNIVPHVLLAHGKSGTPYVEGRITSIGGVAKSIPLAGSVVVAQQVGVNAAAFMRMLHLGANTTSIILNEFSASHLDTGYAALAVGWEVAVTDVLFPAGPPAVPPFPGKMVDITETRVILGEGRFDTERRYVRSATAGATFEMHKSFTWRLHNTGPYLSWRHSTGSSTHFYTDSSQPASLTPIYTLVKI